MIECLCCTISLIYFFGISTPLQFKRANVIEWVVRLFAFKELVGYLENISCFISFSDIF